MKADYVHKDTLTATDYVELNKNNELLMSYNQVLLKEKQELKKQVEEWEHHLKCSKEMLDIQGQKGNYDYDEYMLGLYNGMEYVIALFETREPNYINGKDVEFTNNKIQQKEFIEWLEDEIQQQETLLAENQEKLYFLMYEDEKEDLKLSSRKSYTRRIILEEILQKYKSIIGDDK